MVDIHSDNYYKMYQNSRKVENVFESFVLITFYDAKSREFDRREIRLKNGSLFDILECKTPDMVSVVMYNRGVGLIDDIEIFGEPENVGRTIYFGTLMSVAEYNVKSSEKLSLPLDKKVCKLDCGKILTEIEPGSDTSDNVLAYYKEKVANIYGLK